MNSLRSGYRTRILGMALKESVKGDEVLDVRDSDGERQKRIGMEH